MIPLGEESQTVQSEIRQSARFGKRQKCDRARILVQLNLEFLARNKIKAFGVGMADQKIAVAMNARTELGLTSPAAPA